MESSETMPLDLFWHKKIQLIIWGKRVEAANVCAGKYSAQKVTRAGTIPAFPFLKEAEEFVSAINNNEAT